MAFFAFNFRQHPVYDNGNQSKICKRNYFPNKLDTSLSLQYVSLSQYVWLCQYLSVCVCVCVVSWSVFLHKLQLTFCDTCEPHIYWLLLPLPLPLPLPWLWLWLLFCMARRHACCVNKRTQPGKISTDSLYTCVYKYTFVHTCLLTFLCSTTGSVRCRWEGGR